MRLYTIIQFGKILERIMRLMYRAISLQPQKGGVFGVLTDDSFDNGRAVHQNT
jgi:hypothetical protein